MDVLLAMKGLWVYTPALAMQVPNRAVAGGIRVPLDISAICTVWGELRSRRKGKLFLFLWKKL